MIHNEELVLFFEQLLFSSKTVYFFFLVDDFFSVVDVAVGGVSCCCAVVLAAFTDGSGGTAAGDAGGVVVDVAGVGVVGGSSGFLLNSLRKVFLVAFKNLPASFAFLGLKNRLKPPVKWMAAAPMAARIRKRDMVVIQ